MMSNLKNFYYLLPIGRICIIESEGSIIGLDFGEVQGVVEETPLIKQTYLQLCEYLQGLRTAFDIPIKLIGTEFQKQVWEIVYSIEYGKLLTYGQIAKIIGKPKASRAVGGAVNKNPIPIIVPCHRVVGQGRNLVGYAYGVELKKKLL